MFWSPEHTVNVNLKGKRNVACLLPNLASRTAVCDGLPGGITPNPQKEFIA
jgi:hypothetical protein